ncbi:glycosyltransferase family 39 protein [Candidatus Woesearchaeota archaeon]|nr:glycosyltransferase family 39 protein [Candidatus Woesearchaeota archaeon]
MTEGRRLKVEGRRAAHFFVLRPTSYTLSPSSYVLHPSSFILVILFFALVLRLLFAFSWHEVWWDSGVYIGMGKYLFSGGEAGLWEHIRPPFVPVVLGFFWWLGLDPVLFGRLFEIVLMLGVVWLSYDLGRRWFDETVGLFAGLIVAFSPIFFFLSFHQYTEIPSAFFVLLGVWLVCKRFPFLSGLALGLAFLAKFPAGLFLPVVGVFLLDGRRWRDIVLLGAGFSFFAVPYFVASWWVYGSLFATLHAAQDTISRALGCNLLRYRPWWYYFYWLVFSETKLHFLALPGLFMVARFWRRDRLLFVLSLFVPLLYFVQMNCRDYRYLALFLPFVAILTAVSTMFIVRKFSRRFFVVVFVILGVWLAGSSLTFYYGNELQQPDVVLEEYLSFMADKPVQGKVWVSHPSVAAYSDLRLEKVYYPVYDVGLAGDFLSYLERDSGVIGAVLLDNCGGGLICPPGDEECARHTEDLVADLDARFARVFDKQHGRCWYRVWMAGS